jgi:capsular exopolysaccharide synthesis family protein
MSDTVFSMRDFISPEARAPSAGPAPGQAFGFASSLATLSRPTDPEAEAIRGLRTHVMTQHLSLGRRALAICAASPGVGTSFVAANLAVALSQAGVNTLLIDANLAEPKLEELIRPPRAPVGLAERLASNAPFDEFIDARVLPNLSIIYAGRRSEASMEALATDRFRGLMDFCLRNFEATIVDTPAANRSHGAKQISAIVGYSLIVTRKGKTFVKDVKTLASQLTADGVKVVGSVLCGA